MLRSHLGSMKNPSTMDLQRWLKNSSERVSIDYHGMTIRQQEVKESTWNNMCY